MSLSQPMEDDKLVLLMNDRPLWSAIMQLNYNPASYIDATWLASMPYGNLVLRLRTCEQSYQQLSKYILEEFKLTGAVDVNFVDEASRLLLLDTASLQRLVCITGVVVNAKTIKRIIHGKVIKMLKSALGQDLYDFARGKALILLGNPPDYATDEKIVGQLPWKNSSTSDSADDAIKRYIDYCGLRVLAAALGDISAVLKWRLVWKLPKIYQDFVEQSFVLAEDQTRRTAATKLLLKLRREI
jgi:hypothetical protein